MRGAVLTGTGRIEVHGTLPEPRLEDPTDAVVAVHAAGLCGSDLHPYLGREPAATGVVQGHELVGEVVAVGTELDPAVVAVGDRVLAAFSTSCRRCDRCRRGLTARCRVGQLLGWGPPDPADGAALPGAQAELVRIPLAAGTLVTVPGTVTDADAVLLADNLPTAWEAVMRTGLAPEDPLVVLGLGSVGLCAVTAARALGAGPVLAVDPVADRRARASTLGATLTAPPDHAARCLAELVGDADLLAVVDAAGGSSAQRLGFELLAPGGTLSTIAVQTGPQLPITPVEAYDRNLTLRAGRASVRATLDTLLPRIMAGEVTVPSATVVTHPDVPLEQAPSFYRRSAAREPGLVKAVLRPG